MELKTYFAQDAAGNIISSAIVHVFLQGTTTLATGLTRADGTPLENPFAADGAGRIQFRAPDGYYDVQVSAGPGIIQTLTIQCVDYSGAKADADRAEVAADRADASAEQAQNALNSITGINSNFEQNSREQWRRSLAEAGLTLVSGSFEEGATVNSSTDAVWHISVGQCYTWDGAFPKAVPADSTPETSGGIGLGAWVSVGDASLRSNLASDDGAGLVGFKSPLANALKKSLSERIFNSYIEIDFAAEYLTAQELEDINIQYPVGAVNVKPTVDITERLKEAIAALGGTNDLTSTYLYSPAKKLKLPAGVMGLNLSGDDRILIDKNNIIIEGAGVFNTRLVNISTSQCNEMFRFKEAYACSIQHLTLDGGLPTWPVGTETYGTDIPLVLDQCAHFYSEDINVCNYRHRGYQFIHLWESYFGNVRAHTGGWFRIAGSAPGGMFFDDFRKESTFFSGSESNQVYIAKYAASVNGRVVDFTSPCFNVQIGFGVFENFSFRDFVPEGADVSKVYISGLSSGVVIDHAWHYYHDMPSTVPQTEIFEIFNPGPGCKFDNQVIFQQVTGSNRLTTPWIVNNDAQYPFELNVTIDDRNATSQLFRNRRAPSLFFGDINYTSDQTRTIQDFVGAEGPSGFSGKISFHAAPSWDASIPTIYNFRGVADYGISPIGGTGAYYEARSHLRAAATFNGVSGTMLLGDGVTLTKNSTGSYKLTFSQTLPSPYACVTATIKKQNAGDNIEIASVTTGEVNLVIRDSDGTNHDSEYVSVLVHM